MKVSAELDRKASDQKTTCLNQSNGPESAGIGFVCVCVCVWYVLQIASLCHSDAVSIVRDVVMKMSLKMFRRLLSLSLFEEKNDDDDDDDDDISDKSEDEIEQGEQVVLVFSESKV